VSRSSRRLLASAAVFAASLSFLTAFAPPPAHAAGAAVPKVDYRLRVLPNGLKVYSLHDPNTGNVAVQMWYEVGSKNDPPGRSGFAHLFEHLMFKGTRNMPPEYFDRLTEDIGGANNASTNDDYTNYFETAPANQLERLLWAEAERLGGLVVDEANFKSERAVVEEELRQRVLADPYGRLFSLNIPEASYVVHPYHRPGIGSIADLDASTLEDVRAFHAVYYRPDNANLIVVGNFDQAQLDAWVDKYFGPIPRPSTPIPRVTAVEPPRTAPRVFDTYGPNVPLPAVVLTFAAPDAASKDATALEVLDAILSTGKSSRLYESLVYRQGLAQQVFSDPELRRQPGLFAVGAVMAAGKTIDQGEAALRAELKRLRDEPVSAAELEAARNQLIAELLRNRETGEGRGFELGGAIALEGDAAKVNSDIEELRAITIADLRRAAQRYLVDDQRVTIRYRPESERPAGQPPELVQDPPQVQATPLTPPANIPVVETLPPDKRQPPPKAGPNVAPRLPKTVERSLPNGLRVIVAKTSDLPVVTAELTIRSGAAMDPPELAGLSSITAGLLPQGTTSRSATAIATEVEALGDSLSADSGYDASQVTLSGLSDTLPQAMGVLADVVRHPAFAEDELDRLKAQKRDELTVSLQEPGNLARLAMARTVFGAGGYGHPATGTPASLERITGAAVVQQYQRLYRPDQAVLVLSGDVDPEQGFALAEKAFGDWPRPNEAPPAPAQSQPLPGGKLVVIDLPGTGQAAVSVGAASIGRQDPAYYSAEVANAVLGGGYSARLNEDIRVKRGLSYGAGSALVARRGQGLFEASAQTRNESADEVAGLITQEVKGLAGEAPSADELAARKAALIGEFSRAADTDSGLSSLVAQDVVYGVDPSEIDRYAGKIEAVQPDQARAAAFKLADPAQLDVVVVGDAKLFLNALKSRYPKVEVIEADALDLDSPTLRKPGG
jgi:zinc protease